MLGLSKKEAVGVYLMLRDCATDLDGTMARLRKRIEDSLLRVLEVGDFEDLESFYKGLPDVPPPEP